MNETRLFPSSIVDEIAYLAGEHFRTSLTCGWLLSLEGEVDSRTFKEALDACLLFYPKFKCLLVRHHSPLKRWFRFYWQYHERITHRDIFEEINVPESHNSGKGALHYYRNYYASHLIDLTREPPLKVLLITTPKGAYLTFFVHHAASDGIGFCIFMQKFMTLYEDFFYRRKIANDYPIDFKGISLPRIKFEWNHFPWRNFYTSRTHSTPSQQHPPEQLPLRVKEESRENTVAIIREIPTEKFKLIQSITKEHQATLNEYFLAAMFQAIMKWKQQQGESTGYIHINVPVNLRSRGDHTVGNVLAGFNIALSLESIDSRKKILASIQREMAFMMKNDVAATTLQSSCFFKLYPLKFKKLLVKSFSCPTVTLSNVGIVNPNPSHKDDSGFHYLGSAKIRTIDFLNFPGPWPQLEILTYNERLSISMTHSQCSLEPAERLLDFFVRELLR